MSEMSDYYEIVKKPVLTEKTNHLQEAHNQYTFVVAKQSNKAEVRKAIEKLFDVKVDRVNIANMPVKLRRFNGRPGRRPAWKKAIVTLAADNSIDFT